MSAQKHEASPYLDPLALDQPLAEWLKHLKKAFRPPYSLFLQNQPPAPIFFIFPPTGPFEN